MRTRLKWAVLLFLYFHPSSALFFGNLFGGGCECSQQCPAPAASQPCQMFCPPPSCESSAPSYTSYAGSYQPSVSAYAAPAFPSFPAPLMAAAPQYSTFSQQQAPPPSGGLQYPQGTQGLQLAPPSGLPAPNYLPAAPLPAPNYAQQFPTLNQFPAPNSGPPQAPTYGQPNPPPPQAPPTAQSYRPAAPTNGPTTGTGNNYDDVESRRGYGDFGPASSTDASLEQQGYEKNEVNPATGYRDDLYQNEQSRIPRKPRPTSAEKFELVVQKGALDYDETPQPPDAHRDQERSAFPEPPEMDFGAGLSMPKPQGDGPPAPNFKLKAEGGAKPPGSNHQRSEEMDIYDDLLAEQQKRSNAENGEDPRGDDNTLDRFDSRENPDPEAAFRDEQPQQQGAREMPYALPQARKPLRSKTKRQHPEKCTSDKLKQILERSMSTSPSTSKQMVYSAVRAAFEDRSPDVICSRASFSYIVVTSPIYCEHRKAPVTCFVYFQP